MCWRGQIKSLDDEYLSHGYWDHPRLRDHSISFIAKRMSKNISCAILWGVLVALCVTVDAQQSAKIPRIGFLSLTPGPSSTSSEPFQQALHELGYVEGKNVAIEYRYAAGRIDRLPEMAAELVRLNVDVIVTAATPPSQAAKNATKTIPIVMAAVGDPVATGLVASLSRPGGNITGQTIFSSELTGKRLDLLKEVVPRTTRIGVLAYGPTPFTAHFLRETEAAARALGLQLRPFEILDPREFGNAFAAITRERAGALLVQQNPLFLEHRQRI